MIVKVGGSVADKLNTIANALKYCNKALIIPRGWIFADKVRELDEKFRLNPSNSHWMAIACMNIYGYFISEYGFDVIEPSSFEDIKIEGIKVLLPYNLLRRYDELPHSWEVTSDSIAIWIASKLGEKTVVKVTDVDGLYINGEFVKEIDASKVKGKTCIDEYTPKLLKRFGIDLFICSADNLKDYVVYNRLNGTIVRGR